MDTTSLRTLVAQHLDAARTASSGRSALTVYGGHTRTLRQTLIALRTGERLDEHENPGEATLQVLQGRVRLATGDGTCDGATGDLLVIPDTRHSLTALEDVAVLLTVAKLARRATQG